METKIYGYCRCSTNITKQDIERQVRILVGTYGVKRENIFMEYESGIKVNRIELKRLLGLVKKGDTIVATEVSRITRSTSQLCSIIETAKGIGLRLVFGSFILDCTKGELDAMSEGMVKMMGVFSELERNMTSARVVSGLANARAKGIKLGRPSLCIKDIPNNVLKAYSLYKQGVLTKKECAAMCDISRPTLDKYIKIIIENS